MTSETQETTAIDFLASQEQLERDAAAALPHEIDQCSFGGGAQTQQIFSCLTCRGPETNANVGVCYACFVQCHTSHEVVELFERRDFVCDCGSSVCPVKCTLQQKSVGVLNSTNKYDHCFNNIFCYCKQPYDHEKEPDDSFMMHCIVCEDWFHDRCVKNCPDEDAFDEFVCKNCVANNPWLWTYENLTENMVFVGEDEDDAGDSGNGKEKLSKLMTPSRKRQASTENDTDTDSLRPPSSVNKRVRQSTSSSSSSSSSTLAPSPTLPSSIPAISNSLLANVSNLPITCKLPVPLSSSLSAKTVSHLYCLDGWREDLCACPSCKDFLATTKPYSLLYLLPPSASSPTSPVKPLQRPDLDAHKSLLDLSFSALNKIPRVKAIEGVHAYERMAAFAKEYFKQFADEGRVVTSEDVVGMFEELKRRDAEGSGRRA
ncbi:hypothetical protein HDU79_000603 [Rhizoclosmatium sp. JEL0117]|nr:hypothetical protein HDU79_000603 [Rhizoclosmatium sp. JEL0117]